jgi:Ca-activated chloride channel family protein
VCCLTAACADDADTSASGAYDYEPTPPDESYADATGGGESVEVTDPPANTGDNYRAYEENDFVDPAEDSEATFSVDVDTGSYTIMRRDIRRGVLPVPAGVRVEEYINYFDYGYEGPGADSELPFALHLESAPSEFGAGKSLLRVGVKGRSIYEDERKHANLVFLIDVSGSMAAPNKLGLVKESLNILLDNLKLSDTVGIVVYAGRDAVLLEPTPVEERDTISDAINNLSAGGSTAGADGLRTAYELAEEAFVEGGINRVMLCTDGDFNVGLTGEALLSKIEQQRDRGITISTFGFGAGNYNDYQVEQIANRGNGNYGYIDSSAEAERIFGERLTATLQVIAKDVKVQVDFNPDAVARYRLVGYDNRVIADDDFEDDEVDAAEIGAGHAATAFLEYELLETITGEDPLLAEVRLRYKEPNGDESREITRDVRLSDVKESFDASSAPMRFAAAVTEYAEMLRRSKHSTGNNFETIMQIINATMSPGDEDASELLGLIEDASEIWDDQ